MLAAPGGLAGCLDLGPEPNSTAGDPLVEPLIRLDGGTSVAGGILWQGKTLAGPPGDDVTEFLAFFQGAPERECGPTDCERTPFSLEIPDGLEGTLRVAVEWPSQGDTYVTLSEYMGSPRLHIDLKVYDAAGRLVADGRESAHYSSVAIVAGAAAGAYQATARANWGTGGYRGFASFIPATSMEEAAPVRDLLPDLVMLPPTQLRIEAPLARPADAPLAAAGVRGCGPDEATDAVARRCLRFAGHVGNAGEGTFETHLRLEEARDSVLGDGRWDQRIFRTDGISRDVPVGRASYHVVHGHFHFLGMAQSTVHVYDLDSGARGDPVARGGKTGFCFIDGGFLNLSRADAPEPTYFGAGCCYIVAFCELDALSYGEFFMGISPGWYDTYPWWRADQYVEISGLEDGVYELVSVVNPDGTAVEGDRSNNDASTIFRLAGDRVEILGHSGAVPY